MTPQKAADEDGPSETTTKGQQTGHPDKDRHDHDRPKHG